MVLMNIALKQDYKMTIKADPRWSMYPRAMYSSQIAFFEPKDADEKIKELQDKIKKSNNPHVVANLTEKITNIKEKKSLRLSREKETKSYLSKLTWNEKQASDFFIKHPC